MNAASCRLSWVESANGHPDFPLQNLPLGIFSHGDDRRRGGVAIGDWVLDLQAVLAAGLFAGLAGQAAEAAAGESLNAYFALGADAHQALRTALMQLLDEASPQRSRLEPLLLPMSQCRMHLPARVGDYTDFYAGIHHALNVGRLFRPDNPLLPNYKYLPVAYHGRASTLCVSGTEVRRPCGQLPNGEGQAPLFGPSRRLDFELEAGVWIGPGNATGRPIALADAGRHIAGLCLLNDWSARDIQAWEYQPLGPFLSKSFTTSLSPWVVSPQALEPFRRPQPSRPEGDPPLLAYLDDPADQRTGALDIELEVLLHTERMRRDGLAAQRVALSNTLYMYWTLAQMVAHHTVNGCSLRPGDLFGTGTLSGPQVGQHGSLLEMTQGGKVPLVLGNGEQRLFLEHGDEVILRARCRAPGVVSIGFGECRGRVVDSLP